MNRESNQKRVALIILDGWGYREEVQDNAIAAANIPFFRKLWSEYPHSVLQASEQYVGLPEGQMGNSEVGHMTMGAGRVIDTDLVRITKAAEAHEFGTNPAFIKLFNHVKGHQSVLHVQGLVSPGGIHSHQKHLFSFLEAAKAAGVQKIAIHVFTDGRDTAPQAAHAYVQELENFCAELGLGYIASLCGRYFAMDRDNNWDRVCRAEEAMFHCKGNVCNNLKPSELIKQFYAENTGDEHIEPTVFVDDAGESATLRHHDGVFFFNFRADRARMITERIANRVHELDLCFVTMTQYDETLEPAPLVAFPPEKITVTLSSEISKAGLTQLHTAETDKYAHITYFLNCGNEIPREGETFQLVPSRKDVRTHDLAPEMKAKEIADTVIEHIEKGTDVIFANFANADIVGHTANVPALQKALEAIDGALKRIYDALEAKGGVMFITADHGNAELNVDPRTHIPHTAHTLAPVPAIITAKGITMHDGGLSDVAPTILTLLNLPIPKEMTGKCLFDPVRSPNL